MNKHKWIIGLQVIVQSTGDAGKIKLNAMSVGLEDATITIDAQ